MTELANSNCRCNSFVADSSAGLKVATESTLSEKSAFGQLLASVSRCNDDDKPIEDSTLDAARLGGVGRWSASIPVTPETA